MSIDKELLQRIDRLVSPVKNQMWFEGKPENNIPKSNGQHE